MARTPQSIAIGSISTTTRTTLETVATGQVLSPDLVVANNSTSKVDVSIYINNGVSDFLFAQKTLPAGPGKQIYFEKLKTQKINPNQILKIELSSAVSVNYFLSGIIVS